MEVYEAIKGRRSIRKFTDRAIEKETLKKIIEAATYAPTAHNQQPWDFIVTQEASKKEALAEGHRFARFVPDADTAVIVCSPLKVEKPAHIGPACIQHFDVQDTAAAIQNLMLAAHAEGIGSCWIGDYNEDSVKDIFDIPKEYGVMAVIAMGYPAHQPKGSRKRRSLDDVIHFEKF